MIFLNMGRSVKQILSFSLLFVFTGCSTTSTFHSRTHTFTDYVARGEIRLLGVWAEEKELIGYRDEELGQGTYAIQYVGRTGDPSAVTSHWAFKRAAELAHGQGSDGFVIVGMETRDYKFSSALHPKDKRETTKHDLPYTSLIVLIDEPYAEGGDTSFMFNPERVLSWYEAAKQRHRDNNKMFDARRIIERHFNYFNEKNIPMMRSVVNNPPKDVYWWEAGIAEGGSRIFIDIAEYTNTVTHIWADNQHLIRTMEGSGHVWVDDIPGEHLLEIAVYTWFGEPDDPRKTIDESMKVTTKEGDVYLVHCPPRFGVARGSFETDQQANQAELISQYKWE
jgi:hypothetical protein